MGVSQEALILKPKLFLEMIGEFLRGFAPVFGERWAQFLRPAKCGREAREPQRVQVDRVAMTRGHRPTIDQGIHPGERPGSTIDEEKSLWVDVQARICALADSIDQVEADLLEGDDAPAPRSFGSEARRSDEQERGVDRLGVRRDVAALGDIGDQAVHQAIGEGLENRERLVTRQARDSRR